MLVFLANTCFAKCQIEKYTLSGIVNGPSGTPAENVRVEMEWLDFYGKKKERSLSNIKGNYVIRLNFNKYNGSGKNSEAEDICTRSLQKVNVIYYSAEYGTRTRVLSILKSEMTENVQF